MMMMMMVMMMMMMMMVMMMMVMMMMMRLIAWIDLDKCSIIEDDDIVVTVQSVHRAPFHLKICHQCFGQQSFMRNPTRVKSFVFPSLPKVAPWSATDMGLPLKVTPTLVNNIFISG